MLIARSIFMNNLTRLSMLFLLISSTVAAQQTSGSYIFDFNVTDYQLAKTSDGTTLQQNIKNLGSFKPGDKSFGLGLSYQKPFTKHMSWLGSAQVVLANLPAGYINGDSVGQAQISLLTNLRSNMYLLKPAAKVNPFVTAGAGVQLVGGKTAPYLPLGAGFRFILQGTTGIILQAQWQQPLTKAIKYPAVNLSLGFTAIKAAANTPQQKIIVPVVADKDHDGFADNIDLCPDTAGTAKGCPDRDGDGIPDVEDRCPAVKGTAANFGCPVAVVKDTLQAATISITTFTAYFEPDKIILRGDAYEVLQKVLGILKENPTRKAFIKGYTEKVGNMASRYKISIDRANTCAAYLVSYGIDRNRLTVLGFGSEHPAADNDDPLLQWKNRRVEIVVY